MFIEGQVHHNLFKGTASILHAPAGLPGVQALPTDVIAHVRVIPHSSEPCAPLFRSAVSAYCDNFEQVPQFDILKPAGELSIKHLRRRRMVVQAFVNAEVLPSVTDEGLCQNPVEMLRWQAACAATTACADLGKCRDGSPCTLLKQQSTLAGPIKRHAFFVA